MALTVRHAPCLRPPLVASYSQPGVAPLHTPAQPTDVAALSWLGRTGATELKNLGNQAFKQTNYPEAIRKYTSTLDILDQMDGTHKLRPVFALALSQPPITLTAPVAHRGVRANNGVQKSVGKGPMGAACGGLL
jgi:hypothetical protein